MRQGSLVLRAVVFGGLMASWCGAPLEAQPPATSQPAVEATTSTDFLSDEAWRALPREERRRRSRASQMARYEPSGKADISRLDIYLERFRAANVYDARLFKCDVKAEAVPGTTGTVRLSGEVSLPHYKRGVEDLMRDLGFTVEKNDIVALPDEAFAPAAFGLVTTAVATLRKEPRSNAEQVNSVAMGGMVRLLRQSKASDVTSTEPFRRRSGVVTADEADTAWYLAQTPEGYLGFVRGDDIRRERKLVVPDAVLMVDMAATGKDGKTTAPAGANLAKSGDGFEVVGLGLKIPADAPVAPMQSKRETKEEILAKLGGWVGTKYVWGGVTSSGIDCSGFSQFYYKSLGVFLPRDAVQQAIVGQITAYGKDVVTESRAGDLIFFLSESGRVSHVGISLGDGRLIHSSGDRVKIQPLSEPEEEGDRVLAERALFSRKP